MNAGVFNDFSGGITDFYIPGKPNQFKTLDNVIILQDGSVEQRPGLAILGAGLGQLPTGYQRIAHLSTLEKGAKIIAFTEKRAYHINAGVWTHLLGPSGAPAFNSASSNINIQTAEWQGHLLAVSDSGDKPIKLFYDDTNTLRLRTAGMPSVPENLLYPADGGLADAIALANDLLAKMIAHTANADAITSIPKSTAHITHSELTAQNTTLSALTPATDLSSLISNLNTMRAVYHEHILDAQKLDEQRKYHIKALNTFSFSILGSIQVNIVTQPLLNFVLKDENKPVSGDISIIIKYLNDLRDKWNYHTYALWTHGNAVENQGASIFTGAGQHKTILPAISTYTWAKITPTYAPLIQYIKDIINTYRIHEEDEFGHRVKDTYFNIPQAWYDPIVPPNTIQDAIIALGGFAFYFSAHNADAADATYLIYNGTSNIGSPTLTSVSPNPTATWTVLPNGFIILPLQSFNTTYPRTFYRQYVFDSDGLPPATTAYVTSKTSTTITLAPTIANAGYTGSWMFTNSLFHFGKTAGITLSGIRQEFEAADYSLTSVSSLQSLSDLAKSMAEKLKAHTLYGMNISTTVPKIFYSGNFYDRYVDKSGEPISNPYDFSAHRDYYDTAAPSTALGAWFPVSAGLKQDRFNNNPQAASINYTMLFSNTYKVGNTEYVDKGSTAVPINIITYQSELSLAGSEQSLYAINISNWYSHTNGPGENYDINGAGFKKELYRTPANGTLYYLTTVDKQGGKYPNSTASILEISNEAYIDSQEALYTNGGVVENDPPPIARFIHVADNIAYYGYITDGANVYKNRIMQSIVGDPDSVPSDFFIDIDDLEITGISSYKGQVIAFGDRHVYRISGIFDLLGRGGMLREAISQETGCIAPNSIVQTDIGIFFAGASGFYYTDGFQVVKVSEHLNESYAAITDTYAKRKNIRGVYDKTTRKIYFTVGTSSAPDKIWVLHLDFGVSKQMCITTWSGGFAGANEYYPSAIAIFNNQPVIGTIGGYVLSHQSNKYTDLKANIAVSPDSWTTYPVLWSIKTSDHDYGSSFMRKYATKLNIQFKQITNLSVQINNDVDRGRLIGNCTPIRSRKLSDWGDAYLEKPSEWVAKPGGVIDERRHFMNGTLRWNYMALEIKNAYVVITNSVVIGNATVTGATVTLNNPGKKWPEHVVGYDIELQGVKYQVIQRNSDTTITVSGTPPAGSQSWTLWGYPKNEFMRMLGFNVSYDILGLTQKAFGTQETDSGDNG